VNHTCPQRSDAEASVDRTAYSQKLAHPRGSPAPAPTDPDALTFLTMTTKPTFRPDVNEADGGNPAVCMTREINTQRAGGLWSNVTTAMVAA
jgi:hypothetical protein